MRVGNIAKIHEILKASSCLKQSFEIKIPLLVWLESKNYKNRGEKGSNHRCGRDSSKRWDDTHATLMRTKRACSSVETRSSWSPSQIFWNNQGIWGNHWKIRKETQNLKWKDKFDHIKIFKILIWRNLLYTVNKQVLYCGIYLHMTNKGPITIVNRTLTNPWEKENLKKYKSRIRIGKSQQISKWPVNTCEKMSSTSPPQKCTLK